MQQIPSQLRKCTAHGTFNNKYLLAVFKTPYLLSPKFSFTKFVSFSQIKLEPEAINLVCSLLLKLSYLAGHPSETE